MCARAFGHRLTTGTKTGNEGLSSAQAAKVKDDAGPYQQVHLSNTDARTMCTQYYSQSSVMSQALSHPTFGVDPNALFPSPLRVSRCACLLVV